MVRSRAGTLIPSPVLRPPATFRPLVSPCHDRPAELSIFQRITRRKRRPRGAIDDCSNHRRGARAQAAVQASVRSGPFRHRARHNRRRRMAGIRQERLDQGDGRRLHQADQDGDRADHLLHRGIRHFAHPGGQEGRPRRGQGPGLFRGRLDLRPGARPRHRQSRQAGRRILGRGRQRRRGQAIYGQGAVERRFRDGHHPGFGGRRLRQGRRAAGIAVLDPVRLRADGARRAWPHRARAGRRHGACRLRRDRHRNEGGADRRVRRHGLHDRQVRRRLDGQPAWPVSPPCQK